MTVQPDRSAAPESEARRESGQPGGGQGRIDEVGWSGVYPGSGPYPEGPAEIRTPGTFVHGQRDAEGRQVEGGSAIIYYEGDILLGGATPSSSSPPETREVPPAEPAG